MIRIPRERNGFTLLELLVVVIIIGVLATVAVPQFTKAIEKGRVAEALSILGGIRTAEEAYFQENASYTTDTAKLLADIPIDASTLHYFTYAVTEGTATAFTVTATRKIAGATGKLPHWVPPSGTTTGYEVSVDETGTITSTGP